MMKKIVAKCEVQLRGNAQRSLPPYRNQEECGEKQSGCSVEVSMRIMRAGHQIRMTSCLHDMCSGSAIHMPLTNEMHASPRQIVAGCVHPIFRFSFVPDPT